MAPDVLVSRELKSLQDELSAAKTQRAATPHPSRLRFHREGPVRDRGYLAQESRRFPVNLRLREAKSDPIGLQIFSRPP